MISTLLGLGGADLIGGIGGVLGKSIFDFGGGSETTSAMMDYWKQMGITNAEDLAALQTMGYSAAGRVGDESVRGGYQRALDQHGGQRTGRNVRQGVIAAGDASSLRGQAAGGFARAAKQSGQNVENISRQLQNAGPMPVAARASVMEAAGRSANQGMAGAFGGASQQAASSIREAANIGMGAEKMAQSDIEQQKRLYIDPEKMQMAQTNVAQALAPGATVAGKSEAESGMMYQNLFPHLTAGAGMYGGKELQKGIWSDIFKT